MDNSVDQWFIRVISGYLNVIYRPVMKHRIIFIGMSFLLGIMNCLAQEGEKPSKLSLDGYLSDMLSVQFVKIRQKWITDDLVHNRLNVKWFPSANISAGLGMRNRLTFGDSFDYDTAYAAHFEKDNGFLNLSHNLAEGDSYLLNLSLDRLWVTYEKDKLNITLGRQRINWGQTFVWNPNDIFNSYSFFDFDYEEKPGSDALRLQYFTGMASVAEVAVKLNKAKEVTAAFLYRFNEWESDIQFLGGLLNSNDLLVGTGFSTHAGAVALRGEATYFSPQKHRAENKDLFLASLGADYVSGNSLMLQFEFLYSSARETSDTDFLNFYSAPLSVKNISFTNYNFFGQVSYPFTPLFSGTLSGMYFPQWKGYFAGPSLTYSLSDNLGLALYMQRFSGQPPGSERQQHNLAFLRLRLSF